MTWLIEFWVWLATIVGSVVMIGVLMAIIAVWAKLATFENHITWRRNKTK